MILAGLASIAAIATFFVTAEAENDITPPVVTADGVTLTDARAEAIFAGGCFWCVESDFDKVTGVVETVSGYIGGELENPTYKQVSYTETGHHEAVKIVYDPNTVSYSELVEFFWRHIDPTDAGGQFCDRGTSYLSAIFPIDATQQEIAERSKAALETSGVLAAPIVTEIEPAGTFWRAEEYHQDYYLKNRIHYARYRRGCGRDRRIADVWAGEKLTQSASNAGHGS